MRKWAATVVVLLAACGPATRAAAPEPSATPSPPPREIPNRELYDESFHEFLVGAYNLHRIGSRRVEVIGRAEYVGEGPAQPECYLSYGGPAAFVEPRYLRLDATKGDEFTIIGIATFSKPPPLVESQDVVCRPSGQTRG